MSYGSISEEAHQTLAKAMNKLEEKAIAVKEEKILNDMSFKKMAAFISAIKQVASGRFVTSEYYNTPELQIKVAQGAKPGEGGQLPGTKVYPWIAETRDAPGIGLISTTTPIYLFNED